MSVVNRSQMGRSRRSSQSQATRPMMRPATPHRLRHRGRLSLVNVPQSQWARHLPRLSTIRVLGGMAMPITTPRQARLSPSLPRPNMQRGTSLHFISRMSRRGRTEHLFSAVRATNLTLCRRMVQRIICIPSLNPCMTSGLSVDQKARTGRKRRRPLARSSCSNSSSSSNRPG